MKTPTIIILSALLVIAIVLSSCQCSIDSTSSTSTNKNGGHKTSSCGGVFTISDSEKLLDVSMTDGSYYTVKTKRNNDGAIIIYRISSGYYESNDTLVVVPANNNSDVLNETFSN